MRFNGVQEAAVLVSGTDEADSVQGGVILIVLVGLHLADHRAAVRFPKGVTSVRSTDRGHTFRFFHHLSVLSSLHPISMGACEYFTSLKVKEKYKKL